MLYEVSFYDLIYTMSFIECSKVCLVYCLFCCTVLSCCPVVVSLSFVVYFVLNMKFLCCGVMWILYFVACCILLLCGVVYFHPWHCPNYNYLFFVMCRCGLIIGIDYPVKVIVTQRSVFCFQYIGTVLCLLMSAWCVKLFWSLSGLS